MTERLYLYDTTLRDGAQTEGVDFTGADKRAVAKLLDELGVDYVEGGFPGANEVDTELFDRPPELTNARLTAFGMTRRAGRSTANDPGLQGTLAARCGAVCLVAKSWDFHVEVALQTSPQENLASITASVAAIVATGREAMIDCEHFFDGYRANPEYALACAQAAYDAGARWIVLCDTNGGTLPDEIASTVTAVTQVIPGARLGIHAHNDTEHAVANSLAAVRAGVRQVQGTLNGLGERCGNASLTTLIPILTLKEPYASQFTTNVGPERCKMLVAASRRLDDILNLNPAKQAAFVGPSAFATKAGIHASALVKDPQTYEHVPPESVGNARRVMVGDQAGRSNILTALKATGLEAVADKAGVDRLFEVIKAREALGYAYESAPASFELLARRTLGRVPEFFTVESFRVMVEKRHNALGEQVTATEASVKLRLAGEETPIWSVAEGNGPVNALDQALRKDLGRFQGFITPVELVDYRVRILDSGTTAVTRVLIESRDTSTGESWLTVGVSANIVDASFEALVDSVTYKLMRDVEDADGRSHTRAA